MIRFRMVVSSVAAGLALSVLSVSLPATVPMCTGNPPQQPVPPNPCSKPADGCSNPTQTGSWTAWCCKDTGPGGLHCYWVQIRSICCNGVWKWGYLDGTREYNSCEPDGNCVI